MEAKTTTPIAIFSDKKKWENPALVVIDSNSVNNGPVNAQQEKTSAPFISIGNPLGYTPASHS